MSALTQSLKTLTLWNSLYNDTPDSEQVMAGYRAALLQFGKDAHAERQAVQTKRNTLKAKPKSKTVEPDSDSDEEPAKPKKTPPKPRKKTPPKKA